VKVREAKGRAGEYAKRRTDEAANGRQSELLRSGKQNSPGLQPWVASQKDRPEGATDGLLGWDTNFQTPGWWRQRANTLFVRAPFQGAANVVDKPRAKSLGNLGLKPWAILLSHFLAIAVSPVRPFALSQLGRCRCGLFARELRQEFFVIQRMREHRKVVFYRVLVRFFANGGCAIFQRNHVVAQFIGCPHR
jgi:hypothetical protein